MEAPILLNIDLLVPHPQNPRLILREDVIEPIARQISTNGGFRAEYALTVRPLDGGTYHVISGHHRLDAAKRAGVEQVPCWVREMDDATAYMELILSNQQGELSPLEIGMHALRNVELSEGGKQEKAGLSAYAESIGKDRTNVIRYRQAAEVFESLTPCIDAQGLLDRALHLASIHKSPATTWGVLVDALIDASWTVKETEEQVKAVRELIEVKPEWYPVDDEDLAKLVVNDSRRGKVLKAGFSEATKLHDKLEKSLIYTFEDTGKVVTENGRDMQVFEAVAEEYDEQALFVEKIVGAKEYPTKKDAQDAYQEILTHKRLYSKTGTRLEPVMSDAEWKEYRKQQAEIERMKEEDFYKPRLICGKAEAMDSILSNTIDIIITSPPYNLGAESWPMGGEGRTERKDGIGYQDAMDETEYQHWQIKCLKEMYRVATKGASLFYNHKVRQTEGKIIHPLDWLRSQDNPWIVRQEIIWDRTSTHNHCATLFWPEDERIYWMTKGDPNLPDEPIGMSTIWRFHGPKPNTKHPAPFGDELVERCLNAVMREADLILDPFCGSGTVLKVAFKKRHRSIGVDISQDYIADLEAEEWRL